MSPAVIPTLGPNGPEDAALIFGCDSGKVCLVRPDGTGRRLLDLGIAGEVNGPAWSPEGARIVFQVKDVRTPNGSLWTAAADGSGAALLYDGNGSCEYGTNWPSWAPDGQRIAFICTYINAGGGFADISVLDLATLERTKLLALKYPMGSDNPIAWSPDGRTLAFELSSWDPTDTFIATSYIATISVSGGKPKQLTDPTLLGAHPDWSPDGSRIAFNDHDTGGFFGLGVASNVYTVLADGGDVHALTTLSTGPSLRIGEPFWSLDSSRIWVSVLREDLAQNSLAWVDPATGALHELDVLGKRFQERPSAAP